MPKVLKAREIEVILNSIHEGIIAVDEEGRITLFNPTAERLMETSAAKSLGRKAEEIIPNTRLPEVLKTGIPELNRQQSLGSTIIITNRMPVCDACGKIVGAVAVFRDVSEIRKLAEEITSLKETRQLLQSIINSTQDAISVVDKKGNGIIINLAYTQLTGLTEEDVLGQPATVDIAEGESIHFRVLQTGQPIKEATMKVGPLRREVLVNAAPIIVNNRLKGSVAVIHDISEIRRLSEELAHVKSLMRRLESKYTFEDIIGKSETILATIQQAKLAAPTPATILLRGESGTGKELFAHAIHYASGRKGRFIRVNCAAVPDSLLESELFGYVEGAFTGARKGGHRGYFEEANGGTVFLDEITEISMPMQAKLLRVLQEKEIVKIGDTQPDSVDVRVIAATNGNLEELINQGKFRRDLYYRLSVVPILIPPLRQRIEDIPLLSSFLIRKFNQEYGRNVVRVSPEVLEELQTYRWPGNVRELENLLGRAMINLKITDYVIETRHLPELEINISPGYFTLSVRNSHYPDDFDLNKLHQQWEKNVLLQALNCAKGNKTRAAQLLNISIRSLYNKLKRYNLS